MEHLQSNSSELRKENPDYFKYIRPYLVKLFTHGVLLLIAIRAYFQFMQSEDNYKDFLIQMNSPVVVDLKLINATQSCESPYEAMQDTVFPSTNSGCRCDYNIYKQDTCSIILQNLPHKNFAKFSEACSFQDSVSEGFRPKPPGRLLYSQYNYTASVPKSCDCFQYIPEIPEEKNITMWIPEKKACVLKDRSVNTLNYLSTSKMRCKPEDVCQKYFCKVNGKCPIVDIYFEHTYKPHAYSGYNFTVLDFNYDVWNLHATTKYNKTYDDKESYENTVLMPVLDLHISRNGKCVSGIDSLTTQYSLVPDQSCALDQRFYSISKLPMADVLNINDGYYEYLSASLPLFKMMTSNDNNKWSLDLEYPVYRNTLSCLMNNYDAFQGYYYEIVETDPLYHQKAKLTNILSTFVQLNRSNLFLKFIQIGILALNLLVVVINLIIIVYKFVRIFKDCSQCLINFFSKEVYISFTMDTIIAILGGFAFFSMYYYNSFIDTLLGTKCADDYVKYKLSSYSDSLQNAAEQNFQIFIIMLMKLFILLFSLIYYVSMEKCKIGCQRIAHIIIENLNEGDEDPNEVHLHIKNARKKSSTDYFKTDPNENNDNAQGEGEDNNNKPSKTNTGELRLSIKEDKTDPDDDTQKQDKTGSNKQIEVNNNDSGCQNEDDQNNAGEQQVEDNNIVRNINNNEDDQNNPSRKQSSNIEEFNKMLDKHNKTR